MCRKAWTVNPIRKTENFRYRHGGPYCFMAPAIRWPRGHRTGIDGQRQGNPMLRAWRLPQRTMKGNIEKNIEKNIDSIPSARCFVIKYLKITHFSLETQVLLSNVTHSVSRHKTVN
jgi:hypothetical protein